MKYKNETSFAAAGTTVYVECYRMKTIFPMYGYHRIIHISFLIILPLMALLIAVLNIATIKIFSGKKFRTIPANVYVLNTGIVDLCSGIILLPIVTFHHGYILVRIEQICIVYAVMVCISHLMQWLSFLLVFGMGVERFVTIFRPYDRSKVLPTHRKIIVSIWLLAIAIVVSSFFVDQFVISKYTAVLLVPIIIICSFVIHIRIAWITKKVQKDIYRQQYHCISLNNNLNQYNFNNCTLNNNKDIENIKCLSDDNSKGERLDSKEDNTIIKISGKSKNKGNINNTKSQDHTPNVSPQNSVNSLDSSLTDSSINKFHKKFIQKEHKINRLTFFMLTSLTLSYVPYCVTTIVWASKKEKSSLLYTLFKITHVLMALKCCVNPILYFYYLPSARCKLKLRTKKR